MEVTHPAENHRALYVITPKIVSTKSIWLADHRLFGDAGGRVHDALPSLKRLSETGGLPTRLPAS